MENQEVIVTYSPEDDVVYVDIGEEQWALTNAEAVALRSGLLGVFPLLTTL